MAEGRLLLVDDNGMNLDVATQELQSAGFDVVQAESGKDAIECARLTHPEVILLDVAMPEMDGIETCRRLKADSETSHIPILFLTARRTSEDWAVEALEAGGNDFLTKPYTPTVLFARVRSQIAIYRAQDKLRKMAMTDELTGAYSRRFLFQAVRRAIKAGVRAQTASLTCLFIDADFFKSVNDERGHDVGDELLIRLVQTFQETVREIDLVARLGGDEFVVMLPDTDTEAAARVANRIRAQVELRCSPSTVSIGVASLDYRPAYEEKVGDDVFDDAIRRVFKSGDRALYAAKHAGRNRVEIGTTIDLA